MPTEPLTITTDAGHRLAGSLEMPTGFVRGAALFAHCFTCTKQSKAAVAVTRALAECGIATLRFDFTGLGGSEGEFGRAGFATDVGDLVAAAESLLERFGGKLLLVGHSLGGAAVLAAADDLGFDRIAAIATIGAPSDVAHVLDRIGGNLAAIQQKGQGDVTIGGRAFALSREFIDRTVSAKLLNEVARIRVPLMILHAPTDEYVSVDHASKLFMAAKHPKSFVSLDGAHHLLLDDIDARFAAGVIASWADRYLPARGNDLKPVEGVIVRTGHGKFGTEVHTDTHRFIADEPLSYGGNDSGPSPYDLLLAALGTCTAMTMKIYADRKGLAFDGTTIALRHERNHAEDLCHALDESEAAQAIYRTISLAGDLSADDQAKLIEIADKCPVHRTLEGHLHIHTERA
ncbi:alpha/beta fold hydrolase [Pontixanthobacter sp.]|uniref:bifunctional alpha/beta hydrolase/OsmC family protein n=1 Tax=Pontixanthobacter sp. TaxID=2792078 RepID=UPI003C7A6D16